MPNYLPLGQAILLTASPAQKIPAQFYGWNITNQKSVQNTIFNQYNILFQMLFGCCSPTFLDLGLALEFEVAKFGCQWGRQVRPLSFTPQKNSLPWAGGQAVISNPENRQSFGARRVGHSTTIIRHDHFSMLNILKSQLASMKSGNNLLSTFCIATICSFEEFSL